MAVSLEFIQAQLKGIQSDLREMRFAADVDRRNATSLYNNLAAEFGASIGKLDAKVELGFEIVNERIDRLEEKVDRLEEKVDRLEEKVDRLEGRIDGLEEKVFSRLDGLEEKVDRLGAKVDGLEGKMEAGFARIEQLFNRG